MNNHSNKIFGIAFEPESTLVITKTDVPAIINFSLVLYRKKQTFSNYLFTSSLHTILTFVNQYIIEKSLHTALHS